MDLCTLSVKDFLKRVAERSPTPGGGAVGCVVASLAASLGAMVANLTIGKRGYEDVSDQMESALEVCENEMTYLCDLVNKDVQAFDQVMSAYKLPKNTDDEKAVRKVKIQQALKTAIEVPFDLARRAKNIIINLERVAKWGNLNAISDVESAAHLLLAVYYVAKANVMINMKSLKDEKYSEWIKEEMDHIEKQIRGAHERILDVIAKRNG
ncbi:MAG: formimidoyltetrahydrofolate cyclodeaminase [Thermotogae bacterium]|uniref:cyclodeaminase/cyclohydrolase family protein n=1 Tax=Kosmotoga sp. TaxID=1955248 RepID=UPI000F1D57B9|nr:cyclodeaminase/cyclohydrolase family protein [Kosmotoga sp.]MBO8167245.1 cyclodeaminase/cyclohydrolase family protein [Kosmotoga sp.]RKX50199.1 MAG: formimidoyltetrahydrofolate cyclodeaminase [Thermotogota bacterium]